MFSKRLLTFILMLLPLIASAGLADRSDVKAFIDKMVKEHQFNRADLVKVFNSTTLQPKIIEAMDRPAEAKPWYQYRPLFITEASINNGVDYYKAHEDALKRAEKTYGVPSEIIVAIIGVETRYGRVKGSYLVMDALSTLAFDYPKRSPFFTKELEEYLILTRDEGIDPLSLRGSYAGAMGTPQFMPSSYRAYAVDFTGNGKRNLWTDDTDAIGSVANYFKRNGWKTGEFVAIPAHLSNPNVASKDVKPHTALKSLKKQGVKLDNPPALNDETLATVLSYETENGQEYWVGLHNFYVITRYNRSPLYALAVLQLSQNIKSRI